ncbi:GGDEF domain-containing phosphodiesterase [Halomonas sp. M5N1S17]|uniref:putative bifunctional diguanylate cyclase/phosphodiesterase n=1 Tax=Halomonas alkalisoli TaxID=2907158 RepID=UPI001F38E789|nr:GGDEF domain-containing phosphodiesterase [Halomonas alkalisoli]MCE9664320.1 GGDEF domain-containing phosphodiesterase [Halomonas alkalisoli]
MLILLTLLALGTAIVYVTGGTRYAYPYLMLIPVLLGAAWYGISGALLVALAAGLLMSAMPMAVATGEPQSMLNWLMRLVMFLLIGGFAGVLFSRLRWSRAESDRASRIDPRSGLPNEVALESDLGRSLKQLPREGGRAAGLILVRIADITDILEALGADASDELAVALSQRLAQLGPWQGSSYRFSGAELMLLYQSVNREELHRIAERIMGLGEENLVAMDVPIRVQLVLGSSLQQANTDTPGSLIREARIAMLAATEKHRHHCHFEPSYAQRSVQTIRLISQVRRGLEQREFELHYQPKLRLADGRVCGCEGLIRWRDAQGGLIPPGLFMPKVENTTLIAPVTRFVATEACAFADRFDGRISINVSVRNLLDDDLLQEIKALIHEAGISSSQLEIEITESALMYDMFAAKQALERIRGFGVRVSIDDFGTGFASFEYLRHLPITGLKIDRAFVNGLEEDERARKLMTCLVDVGHALDLEVTAEGVETFAQHCILRELGCDQAQGFLYAKALPAEELQQWCRQHDSGWQNDQAPANLCSSPRN